MNTKIITIVFLILFSGRIKAQESVNSSGHNASGIGGTINYSVGQIVYTYSYGNNGVVGQGVQQPFEIYSVGIDEELYGIFLSISPNPTSDFLKLEFSDPLHQNTSYQLLDQTGKKIQEKMQLSNSNSLDLSNLANGNYFLIIKEEAKKLKSFKIVKN